MLWLSPSRPLRAAAQAHQQSFNWSQTLNLPKSAFPARPSAAELETYRKRCTDDLYAWQRSHREKTIYSPSEGREVRNEFVLHDGPPYANGAVHVGHALNKILKDFIVRWHLSTGKRVQYRPGWDCHGLPIELKALQAQKTRTPQAQALEDAPKQEEHAASGTGMTASEVRTVARALATETIATQMKSFQGWGVMGEWDKPYRTMDADFELGQLGVFREMVRKRLISRHHRPVYWSPSSRTALAEAELEYDDNHKCTAAFVKMPLVRLPKALQLHARLARNNISALIWTTTPWTLPANKAVAVNAQIEYTLICLTSPSHCEQQQLLIAKDRVQHVLSLLPHGTSIDTIVGTISGAELADGEAACFNLFTQSESPILSADYVTESSGTGLVHTAPGHGMEDYELCHQHGIGPALAPVDDEGRFTADAFQLGHFSDRLNGLSIETEGMEKVLEILATPQQYLPPGLFDWKGSLVFATHKLTHKNPIDWRTKKPVIMRATAQWFADASAIKDRALTALESVNFVPEGGVSRLRSFINGRSQWCISRQRAWGVPIPALYHKQTSEACITSESIDHIIQVVKERGTDAWYSDADDDPAWVHPSLEAGMWTRGKDTMDVWFDSGTTWTTLDNGRADVYIEGTDQHRGWFQSSLLTAVATQDSNEASKAPFDSLITHGFTLDAEGRKMSKSVGNVISPDQIVDGSLLPPLKVKKQRGKNKTAEAPATQGPQYDAMGPDVLRLWVASSDYTRDVSISVPVLQSVQQALQKYRVTFKFLLGVLSDHDPRRPTDLQNLTFADEAIRDRLAQVHEQVRYAYQEYKFHRAVTEINNFVNIDLSSFYFEIIKDVMYTGSAAARHRTQWVLHSLLAELSNMLGPICPHLMEEVWEFTPAQLKAVVEEGNPLRAIWSRGPLPDIGEDTVGDKLQTFRQLSAAVKLAQEQARNAGKLKSGLACEITICLAKTEREGKQSLLAQRVKEWRDSGELADLLVVSQVTVIDPPELESHDTSDTLATEAGSHGGGSEPGWRFEQRVEGDEGTVVAVLPPAMHKCVRCWRHMADEPETACQRCVDVVAEKERQRESSLQGDGATS